MVDEQSILDQIKAMEGWAIQARQKIYSQKFSDVDHLLKLVDVQGRKLEWRSGVSGLKHLPELDDVKVLRTKITQARAASQRCLTALTSVAKLAKNEGKKPAQVAIIRKEKEKYLKIIGEHISILIETLKIAVAISSQEPWLNPQTYIKLENRNALLQLLRKEGFFSSMDTRVRRDLVNKIEIRRVSLKGVNLVGADLSGLVLMGADLESANLRQVNLEKVVLSRANLVQADLTEASLEGAFIDEANFFRSRLVGANVKSVHADHVNFSHADLRRANLNGSLMVHANFNNAKLDYASLQRTELKFALLAGTVAEYADFSESVMEAVIFNSANLQWAKFVKTLLWSATWQNARVAEADFKNALGLHRAQFQLAIHFEQAKNVQFNRTTNA